jgi:hypothetical protein
VRLHTRSIIGRSFFDNSQEWLSGYPLSAVVQALTLRAPAEIKAVPTGKIDTKMLRIVGGVLSIFGDSPARLGKTNRVLPPSRVVARYGRSGFQERARAKFRVLRC